MNLDEELDNYNQATEPMSRVNLQAQRPTPASGQVIPPTPVPVPTTGAPRSRMPRISRRKLMGASIVGLAGLGIGGVAAEMWVQHGGLSNLFHGPIASNMQIGHLLRRAGFGASSTDLATYRSLSYSGAADRLLNYSQVSDADTENRLKALNLNLDNPVDQQSWWLLRMAWTQRPLLEKMTLFWHGHFCSGIDKVDNFPAMLNQNQTFRQLGMGSFRALTQAVAVDPAMLAYLDNADNLAKAPNENWALPAPRMPILTGRPIRVSAMLAAVCECRKRLSHTASATRKDARGRPRRRGSPGGKTPRRPPPTRGGRSVHAVRIPAPRSCRCRSARRCRSC